MNANDVRILRTIGFTAFLGRPPSFTSASPGRLARRLGLSVQTVNARLRGMERAGIIAGYRTYPHFRLLGVDVVSLHLRAEDAATKRAGREEMQRLPGTWGVFDFQGPDLCLDLVAPDAAHLRETVEHAQRAFGAPASEFYAYDLPKVDLELSSLDWRILETLRHDARTPLPVIAERLRLSVRTIRRRIDRMDRAGGLDTVAIVDPSRLDGVLFLMVLRFDPKAPSSLRRSILALFKDRWFVQWSPPNHADGQLVVQLLARSAREVEDLRREAESVPGVASAEALVSAGVTLNEDWIDQTITARAHGPERPRTAPLLVAR